MNIIKWILIKSFILKIFDISSKDNNILILLSFFNGLKNSIEEKISEKKAISAATLNKIKMTSLIFFLN